MICRSLNGLWRRRYFIKEQNIDLNDLAMDMYMTPALKGIIYNEACKKNMLVEKPLKNDIDDFF